MALTLIKEDGTGKVDANSYASAADGDAYHEGHLYASAWTGATLANKEKALVMATRLIDGEYQFNGFKGERSAGVAMAPQALPRPGPCRGRLPAQRVEHELWRRYLGALGHRAPSRGAGDVRTGPRVDRRRPHRTAARRRLDARSCRWRDLLVS